MPLPDRKIMTENSFLEKKQRPDLPGLKKALGDSFEIWENFLNELKKDYKFINEEWKYYGTKYGWSLKIYLKKRNLFFFTAGKNCFIIAFVFGDRGVKAVENSGLSPDLINKLVTAPRYEDGRGIKITVQKTPDIVQVNNLVKIKIEN
jgi:hypothetical protein